MRKGVFVIWLFLSLSCFTVPAQEVIAWDLPCEASADSPLVRVEDTIGSVPVASAFVLNADTVLNYARQFVGTTYHRGGVGNGHFDCSGFVMTVFAHFGKNLPHSSAAQAQTVQRISREEAVPGDLVFYEGRKRNHQVGHVGILTQIAPDGDFAFIHASTHTGVIVSRNSEAYYACRLEGFGRVIAPAPEAALTNSLVQPNDSIIQSEKSCFNE